MCTARYTTYILEDDKNLSKHVECNLSCVFRKDKGK